MTDEDRPSREFQEESALYVLGALGDEEARRFEERLRTASALDKSELEAFCAVVKELPFSVESVAPARSLRDRLLTRIASVPQQSMPDPGLTFVRSSELDWQEVGVGVSVKVLHSDLLAGRVTTLMRMAPGSRYGPHRHAQIEEIYVLDGSCICSGRLIQAGDYHRAEASSVHPETVSEQGCLALIMSSSRNEPLA